MGLLSRGMAFLGRVGAESNSETVTYFRPGFSSFPVAAVIGGRGFEQEDQTDLPARFARWDADFVIRVEDFEAALTTAGIDSFTPDEGDRITWDGRNYRVYADGGIPAWDYGEVEQVTYRIHARVET